MHRVLERPPLTWGECYSSLPLAIYGALRYTRKRGYTMTDVIVHTTHAFRVSANKQAMFVGDFDLVGITGQALDNLGFDTSFIHERQLAELTPELHRKALSLIRDSIDRGIPVIGHNLDNYEYGLIYGYDDEREVLHICDVTACSGKELECAALGRRPLHGTPIPPELTLIALTDREEIPHVQVERDRGEQDVSYRSVLRRTLGLIIAHLSGKEPAIAGFENGLGAYDIWIEAFRQGSVHPIGNAYNIMLFANARKFALYFLIASSQPDFYRVHDTKLQQLMAETAVLYAESYASWIALRQLFPFANPAEADTRNAQTVEQAVGHLRRILGTEGDGLDLLQAMCDRLQ